MKLSLRRNAAGLLLEPAPAPQPVARRSLLSRCLSCWELFPILLVAAFLRLALLQTTEFDSDQAAIFRMAHNAVSHGHLIATSNIASIGIVNPPGIIYLLMLPAAFSADPLWGAVFTGLLATLSVPLTYFFTRRYYGRLAGTIATLLYATAALPIFYARFMWQQNLLLFFVPLYIMLLFRGAVQRRTGWLVPAVVLLGLLCQLHGSGFLLAAPLLLVILLAPETVRWRRDVCWGGGLLLLLYAPYIYWEFVTHFSDITTLLAAKKSIDVVDIEALQLYQLFLSPYNDLVSNVRSPLFPFLPWLDGVRTATSVLVVAGLLLALALLLRLRRPARKRVSVRSILSALKLWWSDLKSSPYRSGLSILLVWQILPVLLLLHHTIRLFPHYFIMFMPGPFILLALLVVRVVQWCQRRGRWWLLPRGALLALLSVIVCAQLVGSFVSVFDLAQGRFIDAQWSTIYYNDLSSLKNALAQAEQVVKLRHLQRIYVAADRTNLEAFQYLAMQIHTPITVFNEACLLLPNPAAGPAVLLTGPYSNFVDALLPRVAATSLVASPQRLGGQPFHLYVVQSNPAPAAESGDNLTSQLQLIDSQPFKFAGDISLVTHWSLLNTVQPGDDTLYAYDVMALTREAGVGSFPAVTIAPPHRAHRRVPALHSDRVTCTFTSMQAGDQLLVNSPLKSAATWPEQVKVQSYTLAPANLVIGFPPAFALTFDTFRAIANQRKNLMSNSGQATLPLIPAPAGMMDIDKK